MQVSDEYKRSAEIVYVQMRQNYEFCLKMQSEYGKWLISTLILIHGAAIGGLLSKATNGPPPYLAGLWWFVAGIVLALASGFSAYWNFSFAGKYFLESADHRMLTDPKHWPSMPFKKGIALTMWIAMVCGVCSVVALVIGGIEVAALWK